MFKDSPDGKVGQIDHETTAPPLAVGVVVVIAVPFFSVNELGL